MITGLNHITLAVKNIEMSFDFYHGLLGFTPLCKWDGSAYFLIGKADDPHATWFCLDRCFEQSSKICSSHIAFSVSKQDFKNVRDKLLSSGVIIYKENESPGDSLYFLDPDGHKLEIHASNWQERIFAKKQNPGKWTNVEWFI